MTMPWWRKMNASTYTRVALCRYPKALSRECFQYNSSIRQVNAVSHFSTIKGDEKSQTNSKTNYVPEQQLQQTQPALSSVQMDKEEDSSKTNIKDSPPNKNSKKYYKTISELSKARLSALVVSTTTFGYLSAAVPIDYTTLACASLGTALCSSSASTLNQIFEYDRDSKMKRTSRRPLVTQDVVGLKGATLLATCTGISGGSILYLGTDTITAALGVGNIALYAGAYTYLKPRSEWNTWVGSVVGAVPPVMGYTAATNGMGLFDLESALVGSALLLWQFPHFFALAWMHRVDYARGGFEMVSTNDINGLRTATLVRNYTYYLSTLPFISTIAGVTSSMFAIEGLLLNGYAIYVAKKFERERTNANARKVFLTSLWYLPCWMVLFLLHSKKWKEGVNEDEEMEQEELISYLKQKAAEVREKGKELCIHEIFTFNNGEKKNDDCPVVLGKTKAKEAAEITKNANIESLQQQGQP